jgi:hypothetical protein
MHDPEHVKKCVEFLRVLGDMFAALDIKRFDKGLSKLLWWLVTLYMMCFYSNRPAEENIPRWNYLNGCVNAIITAFINGQMHVLFANGGLLSGLLLTSLIGSNTNIILQHLCLMYFVNPLWDRMPVVEANEVARHVREHSRVLCYGDDTIMSCTLKGFNVQAICDIALEKFGMVITNEVETDNPTGLVDFRQAPFLARNFDVIDVDGEQCYVAKLRLRSIFKQLLYDKDTMTEDERFLKWKNALLELSLHPKEVFDHYMSIIKEPMLALGYNHPVMSQEDMRLEAMSITAIVGVYHTDVEDLSWTQGEGTD